MALNIQFITTPGSPDVPNEDGVRAGSNFVAVVDGATPSGRESGCKHGVVWYVTHLLDAITSGISTASTLEHCLRAAIEGVALQHADTCDLANPDSPSATVAIVRVNPDDVEYLVLCDAAILFEYHDDSVCAYTDSRIDRIPWDVPMHELRNVEGGFWVAAASPEAASYAVGGRVQRDSIKNVLLCSDGLTRLVDHFDWKWEDLILTAQGTGLDGLIAMLRRSEVALGTGPYGGKLHDDTTIALIRGLNSDGQH